MTVEVNRLSTWSSDTARCRLNVHDNISQNNNFWYHEELDGKPGRVEDIPKPDNFPALDELYESSDLTSGRLQLSGCGYQLRKSRQMLAYADTMQTYLTTDEAGRAYVQQVADEHFAGKMEEFTQYYVLARELSTFQKKWNKDKQYKNYEKAAKKLEKETKKEEYTCWLQQQFVESMMGATSMLEILFDGGTREKAFLWEAMEKELDKAATEEIIETVAIIALTKGYGSLVKAADTAGDVAKTAKRLDTVADTLDNLSDAERALDKIRDVEKIDDITDTVRSIDRVDDLNDALRGTERVVEGGRKADVTTGLGYDAGDTPVRIEGDWSINDMKQALLGHPPRGLGNPDIHHGGQMAGASKHEIIPSQHRNNSALHLNKYNQGVTPDMRASDRELHWWYRAREQGADDLLPDWIYDN